MSVYTKKSWINSAPPALSAENINIIDQAVQDAHTELAAHLVLGTDSHDATSISVVAAGTISSVDVGSALNELDTEKVAKAGDTMTGNLTFSNSQKIIGGSSTTADLTLQTTSGVGTTGADMHFLVGNAGDTEAVTILNSGNVGVNNVIPVTKLHLAESSTSSPRGIMSSQHNAGTDGARLHLRKSRGTNAAPTVITTGDMIGRVVGSAYDGASYLEMGGIDIVSEGTIASTRVPTRIVISTGSDVAPSVLTEALRVTSGQKVGIGSTAPGQKLTVNGDASIGDGGVTNYTKIAADGQRTYFGTAQALTEINFLGGTEGNGIRLPATSPASMGTVGDANGEYGVVTFTDAATNYLDLSFKMPGNYVLNSNIIVELLWTANVTTGNAYFGVAYSAVANGEAANPALSAFTTGQFATAGTANYLNTHSLVLTTPTVTAEDFMTLRLERVGGDALDTINADLNVISINVQYLVSS